MLVGPARCGTERKEILKMWEARHYKAKLEEAMATLKISVCVPALAMQDKA